MKTGFTPELPDGFDRISPKKQKLSKGKKKFLKHLPLNTPIYVNDIPFLQQRISILKDLKELGYVILEYGCWSGELRVKRVR